MVLLHIDSRHRSQNSPISNATFKLVRPLQGMTRARVKSASFFNTFHNISDGSNVLITSSGSITVPPAFYTATTFVALLDAQLVGLFGGAGPYVAFDPGTNTVNFILGANSIDGMNSSMAEILGLDQNATLTGIFSTFLHLAFPLYVCFSSPLLTTHGEHIHAGKDPSHIQIQPFLTIPVSSGYLDQQVFDPVLPEHWVPLHNSGTHIDIRVFDPSSGREYTESTHWSLLIEIE
jgi:hypothetical protein